MCELIRGIMITGLSSDLRPVLHRARVRQQGAA
jgi:hypothetical protein